MITTSFGGYFVLIVINNIILLRPLHAAHIMIISMNSFFELEVKEMLKYPKYVGFFSTYLALS